MQGPSSLIGPLSPPLAAASSQSPDVEVAAVMITFPTCCVWGLRFQVPLQHRA